MAEFTDIAQVEAALEHLSQFESGACVVRLAREPGRREARYAHLFSGEVAAEAAAPAPASSAAAVLEGESLPLERLAALEREVRALRAELVALRGLLQELKPQS
jgi:hypothetical protein